MEPTLENLKRTVSRFRDERNWAKYHTPRNLSMSIAIESAELLEHFQWMTDNQAQQKLRSRNKVIEVSDELADIMIYCIAFSDILGIDLARAIIRKIRKNSRKYPTNQIRLRKTRAREY